MKPPRLSLPVAIFLTPLVLVGGCQRRVARTSRPVADGAPSLVETAIRLSLDTLLAGLPADTAAACLTVTTSPPVRWLPADARLLRSLAPRTRRVVASNVCPPSYAPGMILLVDSLGRPVPGPVRPPGYVDPYSLRAGVPAQQGDTVRLTVDVGQGNGGRGYRCVVVGPRPRGATCIGAYAYVH